MSEYNKEQFAALCMVQQHLASLAVAPKEQLLKRLTGYLAFRKDVDNFLEEHFSGICTRTCYRDRLSACCSREGIITFFADMVINALMSAADEIEALKVVLQKPNRGFKCVYLGERGCMWRVKPIICEMFLCDRAQQTVFEQAPNLAAQWEAFIQAKKRYTWPDQPILFDDLEAVFLEAGLRSTLMYMHNSPGLLRVKRTAPGYL